MNKPLPNNLEEWLDKKQYQQVVADMISLAKDHGANEASVGCSVSCGLGVSVRAGDIEKLEFNRDKGIGITVFCDKRKGSASTSDISMSSLKQTVKAAMDLAKLTEPDEFNGLAEKGLMANNIIDLDMYHPWDIAVEAAIEMAKDCEKVGLNYDKRIFQSDGVDVSSTQHFYVYGNSHGFMGITPRTRHSLSCTFIAKDNTEGSMERDSDYTLSRLSDRLLDPKIIAKSAATRVIQRLGAKKLNTQSVPVLFDNKISSGLIGHFIGAISGGNLYRKTSFLVDSMGQQIFPKWVEISEDPYIPQGFGSSCFDDDGLQTVTKKFIHKGQVTSYVLGTYSARRLGLKSTANAGGVFNLKVNHSQDDFESLLNKLGTGVFVTRLMGQGVNLVTGDYSRGASGFWVENGKIQYPVTEFTIAGNLKNMFRGIVAIGDDPDPRQTTQVGSILIDNLMIAGS